MNSYPEISVGGKAGHQLQCTSNSFGGTDRISDSEATENYPLLEKTRQSGKILTAD